jgi:hypothetical protein
LATASNDAAAGKLREQAIYQDYLATDFASAEKKLTQALSLCQSTSDCTPALRGRLHCDLGVIEFSLQKPDDGRAHFTSALKEDPTVKLEPDLATPDLEREFAAIKGAGTPAASGSAGGTPAPAAVPEGDFVHTPPASQAVLTPLPLYAELPEGVDATKVVVRYKGWGVTRWKTLPLRKMGKGYGGEIPCTDVGDLPGAFKYFLQASDANGDVVATSGRLDKPYSVAILQHLEGEAPHLPDRDPPAACTRSSDCPPGFPGCHSSAPSTVACVSVDECSPGQECREGVCTGEAEEAATGPTEFKANWLTIGFQQDLLLLSSANDACAGGTGYTCFDSNGGYYKDVPLAGAGDAVNGGLQPATSRFMVGYDRAVLANLTVGGRLGYAIRGGPTRPSAGGFLPLHVEGRAMYWFGHFPLARKGLRFFALAGAGMAQVDASIPVDVYANQAAYESQKSQQYQAWKKAGLGFAALGGGGMYALKAASGILLEVKAMEMFPTPSGLGTVLAAQIGYVVGL